MQHTLYKEYTHSNRQVAESKELITFPKNARKKGFVFLE